MRRNLAATWTILETEAKGHAEAIETREIDVAANSGPIRLGVDGSGFRYLLVPLAPAEAFAEDLRGTAVQLVHVADGKERFLAAVCRKPELHEVFTQFVTDLLECIGDADSPAMATIEALARWRELFARSNNQVLSSTAITGLLAEMLTLEELLTSDPDRRLRCWTGPSGHQHDFVTPVHALEVKGTTVREGREVTVSSVAQLTEHDGSTLHLVHFQFDPHPDGETLPVVVERIAATGVDRQELFEKLAAVGYSHDDMRHYETLAFRVVERRIYDVTQAGFPRIVPGSFVGGQVPAGTLRITYAIDLTNEPPHPLDAEDAKKLLVEMATS
jgi:hypothetical protein